MPTQPEARRTLQRAWRTFAALKRNTTRQLVSSMDTLRTDKTKGTNNNTTHTTALFRKYLTRLLYICAGVQKDVPVPVSTFSPKMLKHLLDVLILGLVAGSKVARDLKREAATKRLWDAFEAAHLHLNAQPKGPPLLSKELAIGFLLTANEWVKEHAALEAFKHKTAVAALEWSRVALMQRVENRSASTLEKAFLKLHEIPHTPVTEADKQRVVSTFGPLPDSSEPIFSLSSQPVVKWPFSSPVGGPLQEEAVVHSVLLNPEFDMPASLPLDFTSSIYTRVTQQTRTEIELNAARHAMWLTIEKEIQVGDYRRALAVYNAAAIQQQQQQQPIADLNVQSLKALVEAKEQLRASEVNAFISNVKAHVLQDDQGFVYEAQLFHSRLMYGTPLSLQGTLGWLIRIMPSVSPKAVQAVAACNSLAQKEVHAFAIVASIMYPQLLLVQDADPKGEESLCIETLMHDLPLFKTLSVAATALVTAFKWKQVVSDPYQEILKFLVWEAVDSTSASKYRDLLYSLDEWGLTPRVCNLVRVNGSVHWGIYQHLLAYAAQQHDTLLARPQQ